MADSSAIFRGGYPLHHPNHSTGRLLALKMYGYLAKDLSKQSVIISAELQSHFFWCFHQRFLSTFYTTKSQARIMVPDFTLVVSRIINGLLKWVRTMCVHVCVCVCFKEIFQYVYSLKRILGTSCQGFGVSILNKSNLTFTRVCRRSEHLITVHYPLSLSFLLPEWAQQFPDISTFLQFFIFSNVIILSPSFWSLQFI